MPKDQRKAWDPETMGYGKHEYRHLDLDAVNVEDFARDMRGEQQHMGDVREENTAYNSQSPENDITLDLLSKIGTVFETKVPNLEGKWMVTGLPVVRSPVVFCRVTQVVQEDGIYIAVKTAQQVEMSCVELGCAVDVGNQFRQVKGKILEKGIHQGL